MVAIAPPSPPYVGPPNRHGGAGNKPLDRWVIHCTAVLEPGKQGAARIIGRNFRTTSRAASAHYVADSRESVQAAWDSVVCYHAPPNEHSIGYELVCDLSNQGKGHWQRADHQAMLRIAAKDTARGCLAYNIPIRKLSPAGLRAGRRGICGHIDVSNAWGQTSHWDPGPHFPWRQFMAMVRAEADRLLNEEDDVSARDVWSGEESDQIPVPPNRASAEYRAKNPTFQAGTAVSETWQHAIAADRRAARIEVAIAALAKALGPTVEQAVTDALAGAVVDVDVTVTTHEGTE